MHAEMCRCGQLHQWTIGRLSGKSHVARIARASFPSYSSSHAAGIKRLGILCSGQVSQ